MAEGSTGGEGAHDNLSSGDLTKSSTPTIALVAVGGGGKSPGVKTKKSKKTSLFKKSSSQDEFARSSGRKRRSAREKKLEQKQDSREQLDDQQADITTSPPLQQRSTEASYQYDITTQEVEQKSTVDVKRIQKANKEILKQNTQLTKAVESLRKEKDLLVSEKVRLKSENKCLEKELKKSSARDHRFTKKSSQPLLDDEVDDLKEKIQVLEDQLAERDRIASLIKLRLDKSQVEVSEETEDMEKSSSSVLTKNGSVLDSSTALEMLLEEHDTSLRLKRENEELKSRLSSMEAEAEGFKGQRDLLSASPKTPRKRSSGFFKRGKKNNSSGALKNEEAQQVRADLVRSQSPDVLVPSDSLLDVSISPLHTQKDSTTSLPNYNNGSSSPNLSPHMPTKNKAHTEIVTLQSCLRIAIEEKAACNDCIALLEKELDGTKSKIAELEDSISTAAEKASAEREQLRSELQAAKLERDTFCGELKIVQQEVDELVDQNEKVEVMYTGSMAEKNKRIQELEEQVEALKAEAMKASEAMKAEALKAEALKKSKVTSPTYSKPPAYGVTSAPKKQMSPARERVLSPPHQSREAEKARATESSVAKSKQEKAHATESSVAKSKQEKAHAIESSVAKTKQEKAHAIESSVAKSKQEKAHTAESSVAKSKQEVKMSKEDAKQKQEAEPLKQAAKPAEEKREVKVDKVRERLPSVDSARHDKPGRLSRERSQEKLSKVPPSPTRRTVGKLSRESSIDRFENPPVKEIKRLTSTSGIPSPSLTHSPKVSATRAMFEQKIDETKTDLRRSSKSILEQRRRSSVSTATVTTTTVGSKDTSHSKSYSCDLSLKEVKLPEPSTGSTNRSTKVVAPAPTTEQGNEARAQSNEAKNKINSTQHQQQDKPPAHAAPVAAARKQLRTSENVAKVSRITVTSVASPTNSPVLNTRKDIAASSSKGTGEQPSSSSSSSAMLLRHPTSPSLGTSHRQASSPTSSAAGQTRVSTVTATVRHSSPSKAATVSEIPAVTHSPVAKSQTESRIHPPSNRTSALWSNSGSSHGTPTASTTTVAASTTPTTPSNRVVVASTTPTPSNRYVVKTSSRLGDNLLSPVNKSGSLQNIPAQFGRTSPQNQNDSSSSSSAVSVSSTSSGIRRGPTHKALQRRERKDRPKTMYAGRAETANLVGLISRFQEAEKDKKLKENGVVTPTSSLKMNGSTTATTPTKSSGISFSSAIPTAVPTRQSNTPKARPTSYYSNSESSSGFNSSKPPPRERMLLRSKTVAGGLGSAKLSKKAMLLKWCQIMTEEYENVYISNFAESFSDGMAFCALLHHFIPEQIPFNTLNPTSRESNFKIAFQAAEDVGIPSLLDVEDMVSLPKPDWMSVMTYVSFIYNKFGQQQQQKQSSMV